MNFAWPSRISNGIGSFPLVYLSDVITKIINGHPQQPASMGSLPWAYAEPPLKAVA